MRRLDGGHFSVAAQLRLFLVERHELGVDGDDVTASRHLVHTERDDWRSKKNIGILGWVGLVLIGGAKKILVYWMVFVLVLTGGAKKIGILDGTYWYWTTGGPKKGEL